MNHVKIGLPREGKTISPALHSQFIEFLGTCISEGIWVGRDSDIPNYNGMRKDVVDALAALQPPVIRWPGGCYADMYHWRDGVGRERKVTWNENFGTYEQEKNEFGTDEFMELCERVGAKPWLNVNMLTGSTAEMVEWAEYCNRKEDTSLSRERAANGHAAPYNVEYWGIGNEVWCGGGNYTAENYANEYRKYVTAMPNFKPNIPFVETEGIEQKFIASGPDGNKPVERIRWTKDFFAALGQYRLPRIDAMDLHFYNWNLENMEQPETEFSEQGWYSVIHGCLELEDVIREQYALIEEGLANLPEPEGDLPGAAASCKLVVGEWGNWHGKAFFNRPALYQQCTMRDALTTAITLDIFHRNCDRIELACVAQTVNVLNSLILTQGEHTILTPNYYVFDMYKPHRDGRLLDIKTDTEKIGPEPEKQVDRLYALASEKDGVITVNLVNTHLSEKTGVSLELPGTYLSGRLLTGPTPDSCNSAGHSPVVPREAEAPEWQGGQWHLTLPPASLGVYQFQQNRSERTEKS
jgi:alpha-N-arabinofuranosidase